MSNDQTPMTKKRFSLFIGHFLIGACLEIRN